MYQNILLHIPHDSTFVPDHLGNRESPAFQRLMTESTSLIDYETRSLFEPDHLHPQISVIHSKIHRMIVDMERLPNDPLEKQGFGIVSRWAIDWLGEDFRKFFAV